MNVSAFTPFPIDDFREDFAALPLEEETLLFRTYFQHEAWTELFRRLASGHRVRITPGDGYCGLHALWLGVQSLCTREGWECPPYGLLRAWMGSASYWAYVYTRCPSFEPEFHVRDFEHPNFYSSRQLDIAAEWLADTIGARGPNRRYTKIKLFFVCSEPGANAVHTIVEGQSNFAPNYDVVSVFIHHRTSQLYGKRSIDFDHYSAIAESGFPENHDQGDMMITKAERDLATTVRPAPGGGTVMRSNAQAYDRMLWTSQVPDGRTLLFLTGDLLTNPATGGPRINTQQLVKQMARRLASDDPATVEKLRAVFAKRIESTRKEYLKGKHGKVPGFLSRNPATKKLQPLKNKGNTAPGIRDRILLFLQDERRDNLVVDSANSPITTHITRTTRFPLPKPSLVLNLTPTIHLPPVSRKRARASSTADSRPAKRQKSNDATPKSLVVKLTLPAVKFDEDPIIDRARYIMATDELQDFVTWTYNDPNSLVPSADGKGTSGLYGQLRRESLRHKRSQPTPTDEERDAYDSCVEDEDDENYYVFSDDECKNLAKAQRTVKRALKIKAIADKLKRGRQIAKNVVETIVKDEFKDQTMKSEVFEKEHVAMSAASSEEKSEVATEVATEKDFSEDDSSEASSSLDYPCCLPYSDC